MTNQRGRGEAPADLLRKLRKLSEETYFRVWNELPLDLKATLFHGRNVSIDPLLAEFDAAIAAASLPSAQTFDQIAQAQGVEPLADPQTLSGGWPADEPLPSDGSSAAGMPIVEIDAKLWVHEWCQRHGYPGGQAAIGVDGVKELLKCVALATGGRPHPASAETLDLEPLRVLAVLFRKEEGPIVTSGGAEYDRGFNAGLRNAREVCARYLEKAIERAGHGDVAPQEK